MLGKYIHTPYVLTPLPHREVGYSHRSHWRGVSLQITGAHWLAVGAHMESETRGKCFTIPLPRQFYLFVQAWHCFGVPPPVASMVGVLSLPLRDKTPFGWLAQEIWMVGNTY